MACDTRTTNIFLEAANVKFGSEEFSCITPVTGLIGGEYFEIASQDTEYYVWTDIDDTSVDPAPAGKTAIEVDVSSGYSVADWISAFVAAIEAVVDANSDQVFRAKASSDGLSVSVETIDVGQVAAALNDVDTGFTLEVEKAGFGGSLGKTKEGIEVSFEATTFDVNANQTGTLLLDQIIQGTSASLSASFLELTKERFKTLIGKGFGDVATVDSVDLVGFGTSRNFQSSFDLAGKLILHPVRLPATDRSRDVVFHKTLPLVESLNYDGTDSQALSASFNALQDESKKEEISIFMIGDWKKDIRA